MKLCECGCGLPAPISKENRPSRGLVKGEPTRFVRGHQGTPSGAKNPNWKGGRLHCGGRNWIAKDLKQHRKEYILESRAIAEKAIGHSLPPSAIVHHFNKNTSDDNNTNLVICQDTKYHFLLHRRERAYRASGLASWLKCRFCKKYDDPKNLYLAPSGHHYCHRACSVAYEHRRTAADQRQKNGGLRDDCH